MEQTGKSRQVFTKYYKLALEKPSWSRENLQRRPTKICWWHWWRHLALQSVWRWPGLHYNTNIPTPGCRIKAPMRCAMHTTVCRTMLSRQSLCEEIHVMKTSQNAMQMSHKVLTVWHKSLFVCTALHLELLNLLQPASFLDNESWINSLPCWHASLRNCLIWDTGTWNLYKTVLQTPIQGDITCHKILQERKY